MYGIECSAIAEQAQEIVRVNGYADRITIIHKKLEEVDLPVPQVSGNGHGDGMCGAGGELGLVHHNAFRVGRGSGVRTAYSAGGVIRGCLGRSASSNLC